MAAKDSVVQGSLITCIIFLVLSLVGNFFMFQSMDKAVAAKIQADQSKANADNLSRNQSEKIQIMQAMLGVGQLTDVQFQGLLDSSSADDDMQAVEQQFVQDMSLLGEGLDRTYPSLGGYLMNAIRDRNDQLVRAKSDYQGKVDELAGVVRRESARADEAEKAKDDLNTQLQRTRAELAEARESHNKQQGLLQDEVTKAVQRFQNFQVSAQQKEGQLKKHASTLQDTIEKQKDTIQSLRNDEFESAQGKVVHVMPGGNLAFINLGKADGLVTGVTFSVIDQDDVRVTDAEPKGLLEIKSVPGDHLAEARIVYNKALNNPILADDLIYTPFWAPGQQVEIAMAGLMDLTGDGRDNSAELKSMIASTGAKISAHVDPTGAKSGNLTFDTRFLVLGRETEDGAALASLGKIKTEAKQLGITFISLTKLMGYLRSMDSELIVPLGSAARASDFEPKPRAGAGRRTMSTVSSLYDRDPPERGGGSRQRGSRAAGRGAAPDHRAARCGRSRIRGDRGSARTQPRHGEEPSAPRAKPTGQGALAENRQEGCDLANDVRTIRQRTTVCLPRRRALRS